MEEKKTPSKEVKMEAVKRTNDSEKLTYDQLNQACVELSQQNQQMQKFIQQQRQQLQEVSYMLQARRMDYLFKVVDLSVKHQIFDEGFVRDCIEEIQESLTIPEEEQKKEESK